MEFELKTSDGEIFTVQQPVLEVCQTLKDMIDEDVEKQQIPLTTVHSKEMKLVLEYCEGHIGVSEKLEKIKTSDENNNKQVHPMQEQWFQKFKGMQPNELEALWAAANFLVIEDLMNLVADFVIVEYIEDKPIEEIRAIFGIVNDFTPEEEEEIRRQNDEWYFIEDENQRREEEEKEREEKEKQQNSSSSKQGAGGEGENQNEDEDEE